MNTDPEIASIDVAARPKRRPDVWARHAAGEHTLLAPDTGTVQILNDTALAIWELCDGHVRPEEMIEAICELTGTHRDIVAEDVMRTLASFDRAGLITWVNDASGDEEPG